MVRGTCFICLQYKKRKIQPVYLMSLQSNSQCSCNGVVHAECLNQWYEKSEKCPICRQDVFLDFMSDTASEENMEQIVAMQIARTSKFRQVLVYFITMSEESRQMLFLFSLWSTLFGVILLFRTDPFIHKNDYMV